MKGTISMSAAIVTSTRYLEVPGGRLAYDDTGTGPLVVCLPGLGDLRASYRFLAPRLVAAGYRLVTMGPRGPCEAITGRAHAPRTPVARDPLAPLRSLESGPAFPVSN